MVLELGAREKPLDNGFSLRLLSVWELQEANREARQLEGEPALCANACLVSRALLQDGKRAYDSGAAVLEEMSQEEILFLASQWMELHRAENPGLETSWARAEALKEELAGLSQSRLRWKVLRAFGALPTEQRVRDMTGRDYLWCALQLLLDEEEVEKALCPSCRAKRKRACCPVCGCETGEISEGTNASFDASRYERLREEGLTV